MYRKTCKECGRTQYSANPQNLDECGACKSDISEAPLEPPEGEKEKGVREGRKNET